MALDNLPSLSANKNIKDNLCALIDLTEAVIALGLMGVEHHRPQGRSQPKEIADALLLLGEQQQVMHLTHGRLMPLMAGVGNIEQDGTVIPANVRASVDVFFDQEQFRLDKMLDTMNILFTERPDLQAISESLKMKLDVPQPHIPNAEPKTIFPKRMLN